VNAQTVEVPAEEIETPKNSVRIAQEAYSARRIQRVAEHLDAASYLQIGAWQGRTFNLVNLPIKVGVHPRFPFDVSKYAKEGIEFIASTADDFFLSSKSYRHFDIIFLDEAPNFAHAFRNFCNSLSCAHDDTVWLVDDIFPSDVYSAWPHPAESRNGRRLAGEVSPHWHSDVYKLLFAIHDFFPLLDFVSFGSRGNAQTLIWKAPRAQFAPLFGSLEAIERLGYVELLKRKAILNLKPENEAFDIFFSSVQGNFSPANVAQRRG